MTTPNTGDILVLAGQGSTHHMTDQGTVTELRYFLGEVKPQFELFLQRCFDAFHSECDSLEETERIILGCDPYQFYQDAEALLFPSTAAVQSHPVAETISLYLRQILELAALAAQSKVHPQINEVTGICTGLIPAVLAASALKYSSEDFFDLALQGFRLSFWTGIRAAASAHEFLDKQGVRVLSIFGWNATELETALSKYHAEKQQQNTIQVSTILDDDAYSLSGPAKLVDEFKSTCIPSHIQWRTAHIHGLYHAGSRVLPLVARILDDVNAREIDFPTWDSVRVPLRISPTGSRMIKGDSDRSLLETILHAIFVDVCDWKTTRKNLYDDSIKYLGLHSKAHLRILGIGPGTKSLLHGAPNHDRLVSVGDICKLQRDNTDDMIAIVGMSLNYPGAKDKEQLWEMLQNARSSSSKIPSTRFNASATLKDRTGHFLDDPFQFDPAFFNISPREAKSMDPQQRLLLQASLEALEDSGYSPNSTPTFQEDTFGVFVGVATGDYVDNLRQDIDVYYSPGTLRAFLSGRISYAFKFLGPSIVIDTACSSSLLALHQACRAIQNGECTAALAGGVNTISSPDMYEGLARAHFLSPNGQCKPFDARADGYSRAEGCGLVVVKKLASAIQENDHIYGIIRGMGINQCGTAKSITHPDHATQTKLFKSVLGSSRTNPDTIDVVEAHGTGTQAGDNAEVSSLRTAFGARTESQPLYISSIKGNFGHAEAASGLAGLGKLLLMMEKGKVPPQASFEMLNPRLADRLGNMTIPTRLLEWKRRSNQSPRRAMLNNFGAAGSNVALILEEYLPRSKGGWHTKTPEANRSHHALNISAKSKRALELLREKYIDYLKAHPDTRLNDLCYTVNARKQIHHGFRLSATASDAGQLILSLGQADCTPIDDKKTGTRRSVFVFSGQGHAHAGMGAELLSTVPSFRRIVDMCDKILLEHNFPTVGPFLSNSADFDANQDASTAVTVTQSALFVLEFALARTWIQWGVVPDIVVGHSIGEYAAMAISGLLDVKDALLLVAKRGQLIGTKCVPGKSGMLSCRSTAVNINSILGQNDPQFAGLGIACHNGQEDVVIAGPAESIAHFAAYASSNGIKAKQLEVPYGFHSSSMDPILEDLKSHTATITLRHPTITIGSSLQGRLLGPEDMRPDYFVQHTRQPVDFCGVIQELERSYPDGVLDFIEVGPSASTEPAVRKTIKNVQFTFLPTLKPAKTPWETLSQSLSSLFLRNYPVKWREVYEGSKAVLLTSVPKYPLNCSQYYVPYKSQHYAKDQLIEDTPQLSFEFLGPAKPDPSGKTPTFHTNLVAVAPYIKAHQVANVPLCPASVLVELSLEALILSSGSSDASASHLLEDIVFEKGLVYADHIAEKNDLQISLDGGADKKSRFSMSSVSGRQLYCSGLVSRHMPGTSVDRLLRKSTFVERQRKTMLAHLEDYDSFSARTIYNVIFPRVVAYSEPFLLLKKLSVSESRLEGCGKLEIASSMSEKNFVCHPAFLDTLLHAPGFIVNMYVPTDVAGICVGIEQVYLPSAQDIETGEMSIICTLTDLGHSVTADAYVTDSANKLIAYVEGARFKKIPLKSFQAGLSRSVKQPTATKASSIQALTVQRASAEPAPVSGISAFKIEETILSIIQECCGVTLDRSNTMTLQEAGVDSLMFIEMTDMIGNRLPHVKLDRDRLENCSTLQEIVQLVSGASPSSTPAPTSSQITPISSQIAELPEVHQLLTVSSRPISRDAVSPIKALLEEVCGINMEGEMMDQKLGTLGVDSLLSIELVDELRDTHGLTIDSHQIDIAELTANELSDLLSDRLGQSSAGSMTPDSSEAGIRTPDTLPDTPLTPTSGGSEFQSTLLRQSFGPQKPTLWLFHDGSGYSSQYSRMSGINLNVVGISSPDPSSDIKSLEELASFYIKKTKITEEQPIYLGGWSFGGVLAFEVARQLQILGRKIAGLILIDSPLPVDHKGLPQEVISYVISKATSKGPVTDAAKQARERLGKRFEYHAGLLESYRAKPQDGKISCVVLKCARSLDTETLCNVSYPWLSDDGVRARQAEQWGQLVGRKVPVLDLECNHFEVFDVEHVASVSKAVVRACELLDQA
ncbi:hypothetical protein F5Y16DRAFT_412155 [Xylariaceae sp. FL0255]|nr:hypothetical protein F5Y16DRAFT_412155 [Xylariaceae sp. FL0255]